MAKPNLLVLSPPDHYALRNLAAIKDAAHIFIDNEGKTAKEFARTADIILYSGLTGKSVSFPEVFAAAGQLKWIHSLSAGVEKLMFPALIDSAVPVTNARGVFKRSLAEFAVLGILYFTKRVRLLVDNQRAGKWESFSTEFANNKVIGRECALLAKPLGVKIHALRRNPERSANDPLLDRIFPAGKMHEMLSEIDVLLAAAPLTPETHHLIGEAAFEAMKLSAIVMNVGRGPVIDEAALIRALEAKQIAGAALDVFEEEPLPADSPLWGMENVLLSPHCTDRTVNPDWLDLSMQRFVENFWRFVKGQPLEYVVDKKAGY
jgi:phosphoglycerate dehydrogenase-like enzyme